MVKIRVFSDMVTLSRPYDINIQSHADEMDRCNLAYKASFVIHTEANSHIPASCIRQSLQPLDVWALVVLCCSNATLDKLP